MTINKRLNSIIFLLAAFFTVAGQEKKISLAGTWKFRIDQNDIGIKEKWFVQSLDETIQLPGSMLTNDKGDEPTLETKWTASIYDSSWFFNPRLAKYRQPGNLKFPFWLTPAKYYTGAAWYQKEVLIPAGWTNRSITLFLERVHTICTVWIDGNETGTQNSLATAQEFDLSNFLSAGKHTITIRIDNRIKDMNVGPDSHSVTDHTQGNWNGITGAIELKSLPSTHLLDVQVYPDIKRKLALVKVWLTKTTMEKITLRFGAVSFNTSIKQTIPVITRSVFSKELNDTNLVEIEVPMGKDLLLWDEFDPALYKMSIYLTDESGKTLQSNTICFGMRKFGTEGTHFTINDRPVFLRGTVNNCEFPLTGFPPTNTAAWQRIFKIAKAHGLNHMRFHSWCPPEAAFIAADLEGFYLQPEADSWPNHGTSLGDGRFIDKYIYDETTRILKAYGNYASFCMMAAGNEPAGGNQAKWLAGFINYFKQKDSRRLYTGASVAMSWPLVPENEYMIKSGARNLSWTSKRPESDSDYRRAIEKFTMPYVTHEQGQWCVFPDFSEIKKYTGAYKAKNFEMFREDLQDQGMGDEAALFTMASGKLQTICYKNEIEKSLRTPGLGGFQLLGLQDFPGQGSAIVGTLNAFWEEKGYTSPAAFKRFCAATVPLIRTSKFVFKNNEILQAKVEIFHFGKKELTAAVVKCRLTDAKGKLLEEKKIPATTIVVGKNTSVGELAFGLQRFSKAMQLKLEISIEGTDIANSWDFWVYPANLPAINNDDIYYTDTLDSRAESILNSGGNVFMRAAGKVVKGKEIIQQFTPVFWNTSWFKMRPPHTTGFVLDPTHPAFKSFPTEYHSNLQWWEIVAGAQVMHLEDFPKDFRPLVQPIDTWFMNRRLAMIMEMKVGKGKLLVCSADLSTNLEERPAARQLLYSLQQYILSVSFNPVNQIDINIVKELFRSPSKYTFNAYTKDSPDELKPKSIITNTKQ